MLILLLRVMFIFLAMGAGHNSGHYLYRNIFDEGMPWWFGAAMGFSVSITLIAAEQGFRHRFSRSLVAFLVGLGGGLLLSLIVVTVLHVVVQDQNLANNLDAPLSLVTTYLVLVTVLRNLDRWRLVLPFVELRSEHHEGGVLVIDGGMITDGRLPGLLQAGFTAHRVMLHRSCLTRWEKELTAGDAQIAKRAQRALEIVGELRSLTLPVVEVDDSEIPNSDGPSDLLIRLARLENARILTSDRELVRRANAEGVPVIDLHALTQLLAPVVRVGESFPVRITKPGEAKGQGVGQLDDGTLVVVSGAVERIGQDVTVSVLRIHTTANGRVVFAELS